jgi:hypothetical protein
MSIRKEVTFSKEEWKAIEAMRLTLDPQPNLATWLRHLVRKGMLHYQPSAGEPEIESALRDE